jgi:hypothetical protein
VIKLLKTRTRTKEETGLDKSQKKEREQEEG